VAEGEEGEGSEIANLRGPTSFTARSPLWHTTTEWSEKDCGELEITEMQAVRERSLRHRLRDDLSLTVI
jgi:hypothetical protein